MFITACAFVCEQRTGRGGGGGGGSSVLLVSTVGVRHLIAVLL